MWFKKKSQISGYNPNTASGGGDIRTGNSWLSWSVSQTLPSAIDAGNYFYLPALGYYFNAYLTSLGSEGYYWSSSSTPYDSEKAYCLLFSSYDIEMVNYYRFYGLRVGGFE